MPPIARVIRTLSRRGPLAQTLAARLCSRVDDAAEVYANVLHLESEVQVFDIAELSFRPQTVKMAAENDEQGGLLAAAVAAAAVASDTGTFYFAYGSNLSPNQMSLRLQADVTSSKPIAVARLDAHAWIICERGYANVVALPEATATAAAHENVVWGLVYNLSMADEARLDLFEGHDERRNPCPQLNENLSDQQKRPYLQGNWDYNKHYLAVTVIKWLVNPNHYGVDAPDWPATESGARSIRVLVYVDEMRTRPGRINQEYIGRMNRAIRESCHVGMPHDWIEAVMRPYIPVGIEVDVEGYIGTEEGYVKTAEGASRRKEGYSRDSRSEGK